MARFVKAVLGLITLIPLIWVILILVGLFAVPTETFLSDEPSMGRTFTELLIVRGVPAGVLIVIALSSYYLVLLFRSDVAESTKVLWTLLLLFWFPFTGPVFWYRYVWAKQLGR